jgi:hypothetical protein
LQMVLKRRHVVESSGLQLPDEVATSQDNNRVPVFPDLAVRLGVKMRGSDKDPELAVPETRDESARLANADTVRWGVALGLKSELDRDWIGVGAK